MSGNLTDMMLPLTEGVKYNLNPINWNIIFVSSIVIILLGIGIIIWALITWYRRGVFHRFFRKLRRLHSEDGKPVKLSTILLRDSCSRLLGEFIDEHLQDATAIIIIWENGDGDYGAMTNEDLEDSKAAGMMLQMANQVSEENGK